MMLRAWTLVGGFVMFAAAGACSSADTSEDDGGGTGGGGTAGTAGTPATGGTSGSAPTGGTAGTGTPTGGTAGTGTPTGGSAGTANPPGCTGISRGEACPTEGQMCPGISCGLADSGTRTCNCVGLLWECESCNFADAWTMTKPENVMPCPAGIADEIACTTEMDHLICGPDAVSGEYCACWMSPSDGQSWDCDDPPSTWPE